MDGVGHPFQIDDDYGEFIDLDSDDDTVAPPPAVVPLPFDEESDPSTVPACDSRIKDENSDGLVTCPPILTSSVVDAIAEEGLPWSMQDARWDRLFASSRDGTSFGTFMRRVRGQGQTIIVAKTSDGKIVGGYATDVWSGRKRNSQNEASDAFLFVIDQPPAKTKRDSTPAGHTFIPGFGDFGTSPSCISGFDLHHLSVPEKPHVEIFKPSQKPANAGGLKQACQVGKKCISMSDGSGDLSLVVDGSFSRAVARTRSSENDGEEFAVVEFEVYGFSED